MLVSHTKKFIYTKTRKTASTSIEVYFEQYCLPDNYSPKTEARAVYVGDTGIVGYRADIDGNKGEDKSWGGHAPADFVKAQVGDAIWEQYFKFCTIRNPFDKMVSMFYFHAKKNNINWIEIDKQQHAIMFRNWLMTTGQIIAVDRDNYTINEQICMDYFIRYEELAAGIEHVCQRLKIPFMLDSIPTFKSGVRQSVLELSDYYDYASIELVRKLFAFELDYFNYTFPSQQAHVNMTENLLKQAIAAFQSKNLYLAEQHIRQILAIDANHAEALNLLGVIAIQTNHFVEAEKYIRHAIAVKDNIAIFHENLANLYLLQKKHEEAIPHYKKVLALQPNNEKVKTLLNKIDLEKTQIQEKPQNLAYAPLLINKIGDKKFLTVERNKEAVDAQIRTIVVLGCPRGGTSAVAGALHWSGIMMGDKLGHQYEDRLFREENSQDDMLETIKQRNQNYQTWGWKLPNNVNYLQNLLPHLRNPIFINVVRNPLAIACSSATHDNRELTEKVMINSINHGRKVQKFLNENPEIPLLSFQYEDIISEPEIFCDVLEQFIQHPIDKTKVLAFLSKKTYISPKQFTA